MFSAKKMDSINMRAKGSLVVTIIMALSVIVFKNQFAEGEYSRTEFMMDTVVSMKIKGTEKAAEYALDAAFAKALEIEMLSSFYKETSEIYALNNAQAGTEVKVSQDVFNMISLALEISEESEGLFDVTIGSLTEIWNTKLNTPPTEEDVLQAVNASGYKNIMLIPERLAVVKNDGGIKLDLGGVAKGYAADMAVKILKEFDVAEGLVDFGGDIAVFGERTFRIGLQKPFAQRGEYEKYIDVENKAVVTSGIYERFYLYEGKLYHHIIDPRTGRPAEYSYQAVSVVGESAFAADAVATAAFVMNNEEKARAFAEDMGYDIYFE